jgi:trk system potassium uptake protein TrkA
MRNIAVIGLGNYGSTVARELTERGVQVIAIDQDKDRVEAVKESVAYAVSLNSTNREALQAAAVDHVDVAVVCIGDNVEASLLTALQLKKLGVRKIWARAINPLQHEILTALGVEEVVDLEEQMGMATARSLSSVNVSRHIPLAPGHSIAEVRTPPSLIGQTLRQINPRDRFSVNIIGIRTFVPVINDKGDRTFEESFDEVPSPDLQLSEEMVLLVAGSDRNIEKFSRG